MKSFIRSHVVLVLSLLLVPAGAFAAAETHKGSLNLTSPVRVGGQRLVAGQYEVKWEGSGPTAQVDILRGGKVLVSTNARIEQLQDKSRYDSNDEVPGSQGDKALREVRFSGQRYAINFTGEAGTAAAGRKAK
jgi:hypothetical protein